ncbi:hypothetical protein ES708_17694 [subsurface metagenome]
MKYMQSVKTLFVIVLIVLPISCIFSPKTSDNDDNGTPTGQWEDPTTPRKVMKNLQVSFNLLDIDFFERCLNENYFYSSPSLIDSLDIHWNRSEEVSTIGSIMNNCKDFIFTPSEIKIYQEYGANVTDQPDGASLDVNDEHPDDIWYICSYYITMDIFTNDFGDFKVQQDMIFKMVEDPDTHQYSIIRWVDETPDR